MRSSILDVIALCVLLSAIACSEQSKEVTMVFPGEEWTLRKPEELGIDTEKLKEALNYLASESGEDGLEEVFIAVNGYVIYRGDSVLKKHNIYSSSKSFTSTVLGLLKDRGVLSEETYAKEIDTALSASYPKVQLKHFASMTSGYSAKGGSRWNEPSEDWSWTPFAADSAMFAPGTEYAYWDEAQMMFGRLLSVKTGRSLKDLFDAYVGNEIGMGSYEWWGDEAFGDVPLNNGCTGVMINAEQLARFGHLFLNRGNWKGKQLISEDWVEAATKNQVFTDKIADTDRKNVDGRGCYGYNWWVNGKGPDGTYHMPDAPKSLYYASGLHNNMCFVIPEWNMVFVRRGEDGNPAKGKPYVYNEFFKRLEGALINANDG